jgi:LysR family glycine cleavage system transcriptional activator
LGRDADANLVNSAVILGASHYILGLEMALSGIGVALIPTFLAEGALTEGRLRTWRGHQVPTGLSYYIHIKYAGRKEPDIEAFYCLVRE